MKVGGEPLQQEFNRGYDFILNTYGSAENIMPSKNDQQLIQRGIVIDIDFDIGKNYRLAAAQPPFSIYAKIIGEDLDVEDPTLEAQKIFYPPFLPVHNLCVPEIGEEILIMREGTSPSTQGYYIGRLGNTSTLNYFPARQYMDSQEGGETGPEYKYGFTFDVNALRRRKLFETPSNEIKCISIPVTYGDVVQQGRSQSYIRHSFNKNNKKGVLEQGLRFQQQNIPNPLNNNVLFGGRDASSYDPSIGETATKSIHFVDTSIKRLGDYKLATILPDDPEQDNINNVEDKSMIANLSEEIYNISTRNVSSTIYRQVLGEKLVSHQKQTNNLISSMLDGLTGLTETIQVLLNAFIEHEHALPRVDLNLEKTITASDRYVVPAQYEPQSPQEIRVPDKTVRVRTGTSRQGRAIYRNTTIPGFTRSIERPPKLVQPARTQTRTSSQKINFEAIIGGEEDPRFTAPIETDNGNVEHPASLGLKTQQINTDTENLIDAFNNQKQQLNLIFNKATDFLSRNQFIN